MSFLLALTDRAQAVLDELGQAGDMVLNPIDPQLMAAAVETGREIHALRMEGEDAPYLVELEGELLLALGYFVGEPKARDLIQGNNKAKVGALPPSSTPTALWRRWWVVRMLRAFGISTAHRQRELELLPSAIWVEPYAAEAQTPERMAQAQRINPDILYFCDNEEEAWAMGEMLALEHGLPLRQKRQGEYR